MAFASRSRTASLILTAAALLGGLGCSVILNPRDDVQRCENTDDCEQPEDQRYESVCLSDPDANIDTTKVEQVCVAEFKTRGCNPMSSAEDSEYRVLFESRGFSDYTCMDSMGAQGCPPDGDACAAGLEVNGMGVCDVPGASIPAINLASFTDLDAQDVKDQFCASFFCDDSYVCNTEDDRHVCQPCDPELPFGQGGCGTVYTQGTPSCVYVQGDALDDECAEGDPMAAPIFGCE